MQPIDQLEFQFEPKFQIVVGLLTAFLVFGVALDLRWDNFRRQLRRPRAIVIGLVCQLVVLPGVAFLVASALIDAPSAALGLLLVTCCPGGAFSNFLTGLARGDVATSVTLTSVCTVACMITTPLFFGFWASMNGETAALLAEVGIDAKKLIVMFVITIGVPVAGGMLLLARRPGVVRAIRPWVRRISVLLMAFVVVMGTATNWHLIVAVASDGLLPTVLCLAFATGLGWVVSRASGLGAPDRRAVTIEVAGQNVALAIGVAVTFFPSLGGVAVMGAVWGAVQALFLVPLTAVWWFLPPLEAPERTAKAAPAEVAG